ncbi:TIGR02921 family PEP-CTERM protein [Microcoleus sp. FACHB-831]|uniref:TIGR02921 family PEP-CTERM protein n=1 Tax=Microcoleus sp. FACHB-831 TaxID=2692827 RepID=UPI001689BB44|nr:TIGR02921 family PEP-CTERM protein [Microcoleus sp. FACHB-831]MBD1923010.1 TIGR02921 family PEP-CTERM protein [Microcoleus sp. FACHB-831]
MKKMLNILFHTIFWLWNATFLIIVYAIILPLIGSSLLQATFAGAIPSEFLITFVSLIGVPTACTLLGAWRFRKQPLELMRLFYGVEAPLFLLCLLRLFVLRELTPASTLILGAAIACILAFLVELLYGYAERNRSLAYMQAIAHSLMLLFGVYVGVLLLFYAVPAAAVVVINSGNYVGLFLRALIEQPFIAIWYTFYFLLSFVLFGLSSTLFLAMPWMLARSYIVSGYRLLSTFGAQYGQKRALQVALASVSAIAILFISFQQQPQVKAFQLLENPAQTDSAKQTLIAKSDSIRPGLINAYLSSYRYLSSIEENDHIKVMYQSVFSLPDQFCQFLQNSYNQLMSPFLYNGSRSDIEKAEKLYAEFFDAPIQKAEKSAIIHALQSTVNEDEAKAGLLNIGQKKVWLAQQQVTVEPQGDWANVELYEVYKNQTYDVEEVLYYFSLPESAALTGVWLGDTKNRANRFSFTVSPRGAAQKVYNQQVNRYRPVDPALLEQVGPRQYRLRAFPVPAKLPPGQQPWGQRPSEMHLWLTYKVMQKQSGWAIPELGEKRNIFWNKDTKRIYNGKAVASSQEDWLPSFLPATGQYQPKLHQVNLADGYQISAKPLSKQDYSLPQGKRFALILDTSRSMSDRAKEVSETLTWLNKQGFADSSVANNDADLYVTAPSGMQPKRIDDISKFDAAKMTFYGTLSHKQMLRQFVQLRGDTSYDGILLVTDEGSYELSDDSKLDVPPLSAPLWMVHLGAVSPAYDDDTLKAIQDSGGGVCMELSEVLERIATKAALGSSAVSVVDGYAWFMEKPASKTNEAEPGNNSNPKPKIQNPKSEDGFDVLAARQMVIGLSKEIGKDQLAQLDAIHAIAKTFKIVTPYSSMIVLVNDEQRKALKQAEADKDRFERKVENGKEQLSQPNNPLNAAMPEPIPEPEIIGGLVAGAMFLFAMRKRRLSLR